MLIQFDSLELVAQFLVASVPPQEILLASDFLRKCGVVVDFGFWDPWIGSHLWFAVQVFFSVFSKQFGRTQLTVHQIDMGEAKLVIHLQQEE